MEAEMGRRLEASLLGGSKVMQPAGDYKYYNCTQAHFTTSRNCQHSLTAVANLRKMLGMYNKGGLARILEV